MNQAPWLAAALVTITFAGQVLGQEGTATAQAPPESFMTVMHPDAETLRRWAVERSTARVATIDPAIDARLRLADAAGIGSSKNLLGFLAWDTANMSRRQQASCGNCWVWACTGAAEIAKAVQDNVVDRFSIQYFDSCSTTASNTSCSGYACGGGTTLEFAEWYNSIGMFVPWGNRNAAFQDQDSTCPTALRSTVPCSSVGEDPHYLVDFIYRETLNTDGQDQAGAIRAIKNVIEQNRGVLFSFEMPTDGDLADFRAFWSTRAEDDLSWRPDASCGKTLSGGGAHEVLLVGYDDTDPDPARHYWLALNSWGTTARRPNGLFRVPMAMNYDCTYVYPGHGSDSSLAFEALDIQFASGTLAVSLAADPVGGPTPLTTSLTATVAGSASGTTNYSFWWNCSYGGSSVQEGIQQCGNPHDPTVGAKLDGVEATSETVLHTYTMPGTYRAKVIAERGTATPAADSRQINVAGGADCLGSIGLNQTVEGTLTSACASTNRVGKYARYYLFSVSQATTVEIDLRSTDFDAWLNLLSGSGAGGTVIASSDDGGGGTNSRIVTVLGAGTYTIEATSYASASTGSFALTLANAQGGAGCQSSLSLGHTVQGSLGPDCVSIHRAGSNARYYVFTLGETTSLQIDLISSAFDAYVYLLAGSGSGGGVLAYDDDSGGSLRSRIVTVLPAGTYTIEATSYWGGSTGPFTLTVASGGGGAGCQSSINLNQTVQNALTSGCASTHRYGAFARYFVFTLSQATGVEVDLTSSAFDAYVYLLAGSGSGGGVLAYDDDSGGNFSSRVVTVLPAGTYTIEATSYSLAATGPFTMQLAGGGSSSCSLAITPTTQQVPSTGGSGTVSVTVVPSARPSLSALPSPAGPGTVGSAVMWAGPGSATKELSLAAPSATLVGHTMSGLVLDQCVRPPSVYAFASTDGEAYSWSSYTVVALGDQFSWEWYRPDGSLYTTNSVTTQYSGSVCVWAWIYIAGYEPATAPGTWSVRVFYNGQAVTTESFTIVSPTACAWTAASNAGWITVTGGATGTGNGTVSYVVAANPHPNPRSGTLTIAGQTFTVNQDGGAPSSGIHGLVTYQGSPIGGISLSLDLLEGTNSSAIATAATQPDGTYNFTGVAGLNAGQTYSVRFQNSEFGNPSYLWAWWSFEIPSYTAGDSVAGGNFDIASIVLVSPGSGATVAFPETFTWETRAATPTDSYYYELFDPANGSRHAEFGPLGNVPSYTLATLPAGFSLGNQYGWYVGVTAPDGGAGVSYYYNSVTFSSH